MSPPTRPIVPVWLSRPAVCLVNLMNNFVVLMPRPSPARQTRQHDPPY